MSSKERKREYRLNKRKIPEVRIIRNQKAREKRAENKARVMAKVGNGECRRCKINDIRLLTINHINGKDEVAKVKDRYGNSFYLDILLGRRTTDDLEVLCFNCNILYEYERGARYGKPSLVKT